MFFDNENSDESTIDSSNSDSESIEDIESSQSGSSDDDIYYYDKPPKKCTLCKRIPRSDLYKNTNKCYMCYKLQRYASGLEVEIKQKEKPSSKACSMCNKIPENGKFYARTRHCLPCNKIYVAEQYQKRKSSS